MPRPRLSPRRTSGEPDDVYDVLGTVQAGASLTLRIVRGAEERTIEVQFSASATDSGGGPVH